MSERYQLHQGDCLKLLRSIPDNSIDMVLCDLPYGVTRNKWDKPIDLGRFGLSISEWLEVAG